MLGPALTMQLRGVRIRASVGRKREKLELSEDGRLHCGFLPGKDLTGEFHIRENALGSGKHPKDIKNRIIADQGWKLLTIKENPDSENRIISFLSGATFDSDDPLAQNYSRGYSVSQIARIMKTKEKIVAPRMEAFIDRYPDLFAWIGRVKKEAKEKHTLALPFGIKKHLVGRVWEEGPRIVDGVIRGSIVTLTLIIMFNIWRYMDPNEAQILWCEDGEIKVQVKDGVNITDNQLKISDFPIIHEVIADERV